MLNSSLLNNENRRAVEVTDRNFGTVSGWGSDSGIGETMAFESQTYDDGNGRFLVVTPILPDGTLLTQD